MSSKEQKIKRIELEEVKTPSMQRPDYEYWYKDRPLNTKRSNYNTYLDSIEIRSISSTWFSPTFTLEDWTIIKQWNLNRKLDWWKVYFPTSWTYLVNIAMYESIWNDATELAVFASTSTGWIILWAISVTNWLNPFLFWSWIARLNMVQWDYINITWSTDDSWGIINMILSITKIS